MSFSENGVKINKKRGPLAALLFFGVAELVLSVLFTAFLASTMIFPEQANAAQGVANYLSYQGRLTDQNGNPKTGTYCMKFSIYNAAGTKLWPTGAPSSSSTVVSNGVFMNDIGSADAWGTYNFYDDSDVYLDVQVGDTPTTCGSFESLSPRQRLNSVPFAKVAANVYGNQLSTDATNDRVQVGPNAGSVTPLVPDTKSTADYIGQACSSVGSNIVNGSIWYNSNAAQARALICENNIVRALSNATSTIDAVNIGGNTAGSPAAISSGTVSLMGGNNITLSQNGNSITISGGAGGGGGFASYIAAGGVTTNGLNTINFSNANGVSFGLGAGANSSVLTASHNGLTSQSNQALSGSNGSFAFQTATFGNLNGMSFYTSNGSIVGSYTVPSQTVQPVAISGSNGSFAFSTVSFGNLNGMSFYTSNGSIVGSYTAGAGGIGGIAVAGSTATNGTILFSNANNVTFGMNGSTITASAPSGGGGGGATFSNFQWPPGQYSSLGSSISWAVMSVNPFVLPQNLTATRAMIYASVSGNTNSSGTISLSIAIFTRNGSTLSMASSGSSAFNWVSSQTSLIFGNRRISVPININATPGEYWYGVWLRSSNNGLLSIHHGAGVNVAFSGNLGVATNSSRQLMVGQGIFSNASFTTAMPSSIAITNIKGGINSATINRQPWILFSNFDLN